MTRRFAIALHVVPLVVLFGCWGLGVLLSRIDEATALANTARAESLQLRAALIDHTRETRAALAAAPAVDAVCRRNTEALRGGLMALVRTGKVSMVGDPGASWLEWRAER